eukprot:GHVR01134519.1.p1 GENE.GHVR01134519.1~~GHVR01134519.1.p1  ORF type:complete len:274 (-),score=47.95 GHVR01134519.1:70-891(-)
MKSTTETNNLEVDRPDRWIDHTIDDVLILLFTYKEGYKIRRRKVMSTWAKHAPHVITILGELPEDVNESEVDGDGVLEVGMHIDGYDNLYQKVMSTFSWICDEKLYDIHGWFMKIDDDAFLVTYNLGHFINKYDPNEPHYFGFGLKYLDTDFQYPSGGAGYLFSAGFMRLMCSSDGFNKGNRCDSDRGVGFLSPIIFEDVYISLCVEKALGWKFNETHNVFSPWSPTQVSKGWKATDPNSVNTWSVKEGGTLEGLVTLHYVSHMMYALYSQFY